MPKKIMKAKRENYIQNKNEKNMGIHFFSIKKKSKLKEEKNDN